MSATRFRAILAELIDENPFAIRAVLRILAIEFTTEIPTVAVTVEARPRLLVNLEFVAAHCRGDVEVDDIAQEALVAIIRGLGSHRGEGTLRAWADKVTARVTLAHLSKRRRRGRSSRRTSSDS